MPDLPTGTVTLLFTDIEGSTRLLRELGSAYADAIAEHRQELRSIFAGRAGVEVGTEGDSFFVAFPSASNALAAAKEIRDRLAEAGRMKVRIGIHTGEPIATEEGYVGMDVHRAARITAAGHGGQILLSRTTYELVDPDGLKELGTHRLKDVGDMQLFQVGDAPFPPITGVRRTNLPTAPTALVGRDPERSALRALLLEAKARLVTITGPGGIGKTSLALGLAGELVDAFDDGVWFVDLSDLRDPQLLAPTIGAALGTTENLAGFLAERQLLLVLDNFEQIVSAAEDVGRLVSETRQLAVIVTSREPLRLRAEREFAIQPLDDSASVELFDRRARSIAPGFQADHAEIAELCRRLDGIPLAIELAAARVRVLDLPQLRARFDNLLPMLTGGARDLPERQRTLHAAIQWSFELLEDVERALFARLAVFAGGCTLEAAEDVCEADLDTLQALVDKSLIRFEDGRYRMLETVREFAREQLDESEGAEELRARHAEHYARLAAKAEPELTGSHQGVWLDRLARDQENLRAALDRFATSKEGDSLARLAGALVFFWYMRGPYREALEWLEQAIDLTEGDRTPHRAEVLWGTGFLWSLIGDAERAQVLLEQSLELGRIVGDGSIIARTLDVLGLFAFFRNDLDFAFACFDESIDAAREAGDSWCLTDVLGTMASICPLRGEFERAAAAASEGLDIARRNDDQQGIRMTLFAIAINDFRLGRSDTSKRAAEEGVEICRLIGDLFFESYLLWILSLIATQQGQLVDARALADESLRTAEELGVPLLIVCALEASAAVARAEGDNEGSEALLRRAIEIGTGGMVPLSYVATAHRDLGETMAGRGDAAGARSHLEESIGVASGVGDTWGVERSWEIIAQLEGWPGSSA